MTHRARFLLALAVIAMLVSFTRYFPSIAIDKDIADFALGASVGLLIGVAGTWRKRSG